MKFDESMIKEIAECIGCKRLVQVHRQTYVTKYFCVCRACDPGDALFIVGSDEGSIYVTEFDDERLEKNNET